MKQTDMNEFVTIVSFTYPSELAIAKLKLEAEGIECRVLDELTVQSYNFVSNAVGGVKLQVRKSDFEKAGAILRAGGFSDEETSTIIDKNDVARRQKTAQIFKWASLSVLVVAAVLITSGIIFKQLNKPTITQRMTGSPWCLDYIVYGEDVYYPTSKEGGVIFTGVCRDEITFSPNGQTTIPGFGHGFLNANWELFGDSVIISQLDSFEHVYNGRYKIEFERRMMYLTSYSTILVCYKEMH
ncbi:MAG: DUF2007 domain-containing protein [Flavobacteriales bacterium]|nr:DUF2007 domain-containing protein [Flavobacteriales bacterium]